MRSSADFGSGQFRRVLGRSLRLRCPSCGQSPAFSSWFTMRRRCPACNFWFERGEGYFIGASCLSLVVAEFVPFAVFAVLLLLTWPSPPWTVLAIVTFALVILLPIAIYPFARMCWLAVDLTVRPIEPREYEQEHGLD